MNRQEQTNIINDLAAFVKNHREDQFGDHQSLYYEMLKQWRRLSRFSMADVTSASQALYDRYWTAMGKWHQRFVKEQDRISDPTPMPGPTLQGEYEALVTELADSVINDLPRPAATDVIQLNDFNRLLGIQLQEMAELYPEVLLPIDFLLLVEYWKLISQTVQEREVEE